jgi:Xaa-Pro aminopeptidase
VGHANGVNIDNLETQDRRRLIPGVGFSIEPGIYLPHEGFGVRLEINCYVAGNSVEVTTLPLQNEWVLLA